MKLRARENSYERVLEMATTTKTAAKKTTAKTATAKPKAEPKVEVKEAKVEAKVEEKTTAKTFSEKEVQEMIARAVADAMAKANTSPSVIQVESKTEYVTLQYIGGIAEGTSVNLGALGQIYRDGDTITVPKQHFVSNINATVNLLLKNRELIVLEGLTDEERIRFGVSYKPNELLNGDTFARLLDYSADELGEVYRALGDKHKTIAVNVLYSAALNSDPRATTEKLKKILQIDKENNQPKRNQVLIEIIKTRDVEL